MSTNTSITINSTDANNKKVTDKISYVNPAISDANAILLAQTINALTTNSYTSAIRTDQTNLDESTSRPVTSLWLFTNAGGAAKTDIPIDTKTITLPTSRFLTSSSPEGFLYRIPFFVVTPYDGSAPIVKATSSATQTVFDIMTISYSFTLASDARQHNSWSTELRFSDLIAQTITINFTLQRTNTYPETSFDITIVITE